MSRLVRASAHILAASFLWAAATAILRNLYLVTHSGTRIAGIFWVPAGWTSGAILLFVHLATVGLALVLSYNVLVRVIPAPVPRRGARFIGGVIVADPNRIREAYGLIRQDSPERHRQARRHLIIVVSAMVLVVVVLQLVFAGMERQLGARTYEFAVQFVIPFVMALVALLGFAYMSTAWARWLTQVQSI